MSRGPSSAAGEAIALTAAALVAFAANSVLCRAALRADLGGQAAIDPLGFTLVRLSAGALALAPLLGASVTAQHGARVRRIKDRRALCRLARLGASLRRRRRERARRGAPRRVSRELEQSGGEWSVAGALALLVYALGFSLAYVALPAGVGALALFGAVQVTMLVAGWCGGERPTPVRAMGLAAAVAGVAWLCWPTGALGGGVDGLAALLMLGAGVAWGCYSLLGRRAARPVARTARNFLLAGAICAAVVAAAFATGAATPTWSREGALLAATSGALTSGLGYVVWYRALRHHSRTSAAVVQLSVPVLAALGGVVLLGEAVTARLVCASALTLGGVAAALLPPARRERRSP